MQRLKLIFSANMVHISWLLLQAVGQIHQKRPGWAGVPFCNFFPNRRGKPVSTTRDLIPCFLILPLFDLSCKTQFMRKVQSGGSAKLLRNVCQVNKATITPWFQK